jgi:hypothetical protein
MTEIKSISVSTEFSQLAKENNCSWSEAAKIGMSIILAERGVREYDNNLNLYRKMRTFQIKAEEALQKLAEVEGYNLSKPVPKVDVEAELKEVGIE